MQLDLSPARKSTSTLVEGGLKSDGSVHRVRGVPPIDLLPLRWSIAHVQRTRIAAQLIADELAIERLRGASTPSAACRCDRSGCSPSLKAMPVCGACVMYVTLRVTVAVAVVETDISLMSSVLLPTLIGTQPVITVPRQLERDVGATVDAHRCAAIGGRVGGRGHRHAVVIARGRRATSGCRSQTTVLSAGAVTVNVGKSNTIYASHMTVPVFL